MNVNDILTTGGDPLMFLDYIGIPALDAVKIERLIAGMADYLEDCHCILAGARRPKCRALFRKG
jgi:phosphoribosylformylglycinamidine cyclo-ligase